MAISTLQCQIIILLQKLHVKNSNIPKYYKRLFIFLCKKYHQLKEKSNICENNIIGVKVAIVLPYVKTLITIT
jgi:hypothetical protein